MRRKDLSIHQNELRKEEDGNMKKTASLYTGMLMFAIACVIVLPVMASAASFKPVNLRVASVYPPPETSMAGAHLIEWEKMVTEKTGGAVTFTNFWSGTLGKPAEHLSLVKSGAVDIALSYGWYTQTQLSLQDYDYVFPFGPTDPLIVTKAMRQIYEEFPQIKKEMAAQNITRLFQSPGIKFYILSKTPVSTLSEFKGKKCAVVGRYFGRWVSAIGAVPVAAPGPERYTMLQTGVIDASMDPMDLHYAYKVVEQAPYALDANVLLTNWIGCWINLKKLETLPAEVQKILIEAGKELEVKAAKEINPVWEEKIFKEWRANKNFKLLTMSEADRTAWAGACEDIPAEWAAEVEKTGQPGWEIVKRYQEITAQLGHKWLRQWGVKK
jgi:TRAP-type C4-dicarboxylate transport system substrate-binding protein